MLLFYRLHGYAKRSQEIRLYNRKQTDRFAATSGVTLPRALLLWHVALTYSAHCGLHISVKLAQFDARNDFEYKFDYSLSLRIFFLISHKKQQ